jgi:hypothetical protein
MAQDNTIPLNFLTGKMATPIYQGTPMMDLMKVGQTVQKEAETKLKADAVSNREEQVRKALSEAIEQGVSLDKAAQAVAKYDPELAFKLMKEFRDGQAEKDPESVRFKLQSALNALNGRIAQMDADDPSLPGQNALAQSIQDEISKDIPSMQNAYTLIKKAEASTGLTPTTVAPVNPVAPVVPTGTPEGVTVDQTTHQPLRNGKVSNVATDWFTLTVVDGYNKPMATPDVSLNNAPPEIKAEFNKALDEWKAKNNTAVKAGKAAKNTGEAKAWVKTFLETMRLNPLIDKARAARSELNNIISEVKAGNYASANLKPFKDVMGAMSAGEYGIATDSPAAAMAGSIPFVGEGIATWLASDKFNSEEQAYERTNAAIQSYNQLIGAYVAENLIPPENSNPERIAALNDSPIVAGLRTALGTKLSGISKGGTVTDATPSTTIPKGKKEGDVWSDQYFDYTIRGGLLRSRRKK